MSNQEDKENKLFKTGVKCIDEVLNKGIEPGKYLVISGVSNCGKSLNKEN